MNRRRLLRAIGATTAGVAMPGCFGFASLSDGSARGPESRTEGDDVVMLDEKGLADGDLVDPYLDRHFRDGAVVFVPPGTYRWKGGGLNATANAALVGDGDVAFHIDGFELKSNVTATDGTVTIRNIAQTGAVTEGHDSRIAAWAEEGATLVFENFNRPDGQGTGAETAGFYVPGHHAGTVVFRNCTVQHCNSGVYADAPGDPAYGNQGKVVVEGGLYRNNNVAAVRLGSNGSVARRVTIVNDGTIPFDRAGERNGRGIWIREPGNDITIEDCDIAFTSEAAGATFPIGVVPHDPGSSGRVRHTRIWNATEAPPIVLADTEAQTWYGSNVQITGPGRLLPETGATTWLGCVGSGCDVPARAKQWVGVDSPSTGSDTTT